MSKQTSLTFCTKSSHPIHTVFIGVPFVAHRAFRTLPVLEVLADLRRMPEFTPETVLAEASLIEETLWFKPHMPFYFLGFLLVCYVIATFILIINDNETRDGVIILQSVVLLDIL